MEYELEVIYILAGLLLVFTIRRYLLKINNVPYPKEAIDILAKYFGDKNFDKNKTMFDLQEKLDIEAPKNNIRHKSVIYIINDAKHKSDIFYKYNSQHNKPYTEFTIFKITANSVIDYCVKKDINDKEAIKILFLTLNNIELQNLFDTVKEEKELLDSFYKLLSGFMQRYNKRISE